MKEVSFWVSFVLWSVLGVLAYVFPPLYWLHSPPWVSLFAWIFAIFMASFISIFSRRSRPQFSWRVQWLYPFLVGILWSLELGFSCQFASNEFRFPLQGFSSFTLLFTVIASVGGNPTPWGHGGYTSIVRRIRWKLLFGYSFMSLLAWFALGWPKSFDSVSFASKREIGWILGTIFTRALRLVGTKYLFRLWGNPNMLGCASMFSGALVTHLPWAIASGFGAHVWKSIPEGSLVALFFWSQVGLLWHLPGAHTYAFFYIMRDIIRRFILLDDMGWVSWVASIIYLGGSALWLSKVWGGTKQVSLSAEKYLTLDDLETIDGISEILGPLDSSELHVI